MYHNRIIPCLLLDDGKLIKTIKFSKPRYIGDPLNAVKIFNDKEVDELIFLDVRATEKGAKPDFAYLQKITEQCFMPLCYGGGVTHLEDVRELFRIGFEKVSINTGAYENIELVEEAAARFGNQSIVGAMDVGTNIFGRKIVKVRRGSVNTKEAPVDYAKKLEEAGVGEIFLNSITYDGSMRGYDYELIEQITANVHVPVIACGGAGSLEDCIKAVDCGASAAAAGSIFVYWGTNRGILINYPDEQTVMEMFSK